MANRLRGQRSLFRTSFRPAEYPVIDYAEPVRCISWKRDLRGSRCAGPWKNVSSAIGLWHRDPAERRFEYLSLLGIFQGLPLLFRERVVVPM